MKRSRGSCVPCLCFHFKLLFQCLPVAYDIALNKLPHNYPCLHNLCHVNNYLPTNSTLHIKLMWIVCVFLEAKELSLGKKQKGNFYNMNYHHAWLYFKDVFSALTTKMELHFIISSISSRISVMSCFRLHESILADQNLIC